MRCFHQKSVSWESCASLPSEDHLHAAHPWPRSATSVHRGWDGPESVTNSCACSPALSVQATGTGGDAEIGGRPIQRAALRPVVALQQACESALVPADGLLRSGLVLPPLPAKCGDRTGEGSANPLRHALAEAARGETLKGLHVPSRTSPSRSRCGRL